MFIVRCGSQIGEPEISLVKTIRRELPTAQIIVVADCLHSNLSGNVETLKLYGGERQNFEIRTITQEWLSLNGLPYCGPRTGWLCGDYVFYRCLDLDWDYAWLMEPDLGFINDSFSVFSQWCFEGSEDLLALRLREDVDGWPWATKLQQVYNGFDTLGGMNFGLVRASRQLVLKALEHRRNLIGNKDVESGRLTPNDEVIFASTAMSENYSWVNLSHRYPKFFSHLTTFHKFPFSSISDNFTEPQIIHKVMNDENFKKWYENLINIRVANSLPGWKSEYKRLLETSNTSIHSEMHGKLLDILPEISSADFTEFELDTIAQILSESSNPSLLFNLRKTLVSYLQSRYMQTNFSSITAFSSWISIKFLKNFNDDINSSIWFHEGSLPVINFKWRGVVSFDIHIDKKDETFIVQIRCFHRTPSNNDLLLAALQASAVPLNNTIIQNNNIIYSAQDSNLNECFNLALNFINSIQSQLQNEDYS